MPGYTCDKTQNQSTYSNTRILTNPFPLPYVCVATYKYKGCPSTCHEQLSTLLLSTNQLNTVRQQESRLVE
jgi:hypothetical protein